MTIRQKIKQRKRTKPKKITPAFKILKGKPQKKAVCVSTVLDASPKKPNSAKRKFANLRSSDGLRFRAQLIGQSPSLQDYAEVLIRGGRGKDLPGVSLRIIPGKLECKPTPNRISSRSKYGVKKPNK